LRPDKTRVKGREGRSRDYKGGWRQLSFGATELIPHEDSQISPRSWLKFRAYRILEDEHLGVAETVYADALANRAYPKVASRGPASNTGPRFGVCAY